MKNDPDNTNKGFASKLKNHEAPETPEVWENIALGVKKKMFYRFSWQYFNVYYLAAIISVIALIGGILFLQKNNPEEEKKIYQKINTDTIRTELMSDSITVQESTQNPIPVNNSKKVTSKKTETDSVRKMPEIIHRRPGNPTITIPREDSIQSTPKKTPEATKVEVKKPVVIIRKRDTIIDIDTVQTYKRKKRR